MSASSGISQLSPRSLSSLEALTKIEEEISASISDFDAKSAANIGTSITELPIHLAFDTVYFPYHLHEITAAALKKLRHYKSITTREVRDKVHELRDFLKSTQQAAKENIDRYDVFLPFLTFYHPIYSNTRALQDKYSKIYQVVYDPEKLTLLPGGQKESLDALHKETALLCRQLDLASKTLTAYQKKTTPPEPIQKMIDTEQRNLSEMLELTELNSKLCSFSQFYLPYANRIFQQKQALEVLLQEAIDPKTKQISSKLTKELAEKIKEKYSLLLKQVQEVKSFLAKLRKDENTSFEEKDQAGLEKHQLSELLKALAPQIQAIDSFLVAEEAKELLRKKTITPVLKKAPASDKIPPATKEVETAPPPQEEKTSKSFSSASCIEKIQFIWIVFTQMIQWLISGCKKKFPTFQFVSSLLPKIQTPRVSSESPVPEFPKASHSSKKTPKVFTFPIKP